MMRHYDVVIIGGGLSALTCGIALMEQGRSVAMLTSGASTLQYHSGSFDLLGYDAQGRVASNPLAAIKALSGNHPYSKLGNVTELTCEAATLLANAGIGTKGDASSSSYRLTPLGAVKPTWLTMQGMLHVDGSMKLPWKSVAVVGFNGLMDFPAQFVAAGIERLGCDVSIGNIGLNELGNFRREPSALRTSKLARLIDKVEMLKPLSRAVARASAGQEAVLLPAVMAMPGGIDMRQLSAVVGKPCLMAATLPPSIPGLLVQTLLRKRFVDLGGYMDLGARVVNGCVKGARVESIAIAHREACEIEASAYVLATGSFMSGGLDATRESVSEPVFGIDVEAPGDCSEWTAYSGKQPYMQFGVGTTPAFNALHGGKPVANLYVIGSILSGNDRIAQADAAGVDLLTALQVARNITA